MKSIVCDRCGGTKWDVEHGYRICKYCGTKFQLTKEDLTIKESKVSMNSDIERLLKLCRLEPYNAKKYANLVLDVDPSNQEALKYL